jgi:uncharacterized membrane protein YfcA
VFTLGSLLTGALAAYIVGLSKTGVPGGGLIAIPIFATVFDGRLIPGGTLPILLVADLFAVVWYRHHARWDVLRPLAPWIGVGYVFGIAFFVAIGSATRSLEVAIGAIVLLVVSLQLTRIARARPPGDASVATAAVYGSAGGFTTFVANAAGPVLTTHLVARGMAKHQLVGTSAWLYFSINLAKIPIYLALGAWVAGGPFFTPGSLTYAALMIPAIVGGVFSGRMVFRRIPQQAFLLVVLALSAAGAVRLLV